MVCGMIRYCMMCYDFAWYGMVVWYILVTGMVCYGMLWCGME